MSKDNGEQQGAASLEAKDVRVYLPPSWLTRRFVVILLISLFTVAPLPSVAIITGADQFIRNKIDDWMSDPDLYDSIILGPEEYSQLPVHWRQTLAEVAVRQEPEISDVKNLIATLKFENMVLVDKVAPYKIEGFIVRDKSYDSRHPIPTVTVKDLDTLEHLGILQSVQVGHKFPIDLGESVNYRKDLFGSTVGMSLRGAQQDSQVEIKITQFTEAGVVLVDRLRVPSDIRYFEWLAKKVEQSGISVELWAIGTDGNITDNTFESIGQIQRNSISNWP